MPTLIATLALAAVMTLGDFAWAAFTIRHSVVKGVIHGAVMCLCLGLAIGFRAGKPRPAAIAGPLIGVAAAGTFYVLVPALRWGAMFPAWMLLWILFALLQRQLAKVETIGATLRGRPRRADVGTRVLPDRRHLDPRSGASQHARPLRRVGVRVPARLCRALRAAASVSVFFDIAITRSSQTCRRYRHGAIDASRQSRINGGRETAGTRRCSRRAGTR